MDTLLVHERIVIDDFLDCDFKEELKRDIHIGLTAEQKCIPCKYLYDAQGSRLFEDICRLDEYYQTRTELAILKKHASSIMNNSFQPLEMVELGAGANWKAKVLLDAVESERLHLTSYVPVDVSRSALLDSATELVSIYDGLSVRVTLADFSRHMDVISSDKNMLVLFLGSTIGNLDEGEAVEFLKSITRTMKQGDRCLVGFDLVKDKQVIESAYNDAEGVSADFNKNVLSVINRELGANFKLEHFEHVSYFNESRACIETYLKANRHLSASIKDIGLDVSIKKDEMIHTEISRKFTKSSVTELSSSAGLRISNWYTDAQDWFAVVEMTL